jgi:hypothetical protein
MHASKQTAAAGGQALGKIGPALYSSLAQKEEGRTVTGQLFNCRATENPVYFQM